MAETMNVVVKEIVIHNNAKQIYVANGMIYNIIGEGSTAGAQLTPIDEATEVELYNALGPSDVERWPLAASLGQMADFTMVGENEKYLIYCLSEKNNAKIAEEANDNAVFDPVLEEVVKDNTAEEVQNNENIGFDPSAYKVDNSYFSKAVDFLAHCSGEDFLELVAYAKKHNNTFFRCVSEVADVINADDAYCSTIIQLTRHFGEPLENKAFNLFTNIDNPSGKEKFLEFWKALQIINFIA
jgi:hypothetical protein